ncbi:GntR family transcriptional regulator [Actinomadura chibensis]|nr:GntR family transcriptional regulator [Actinomadura chibensis]
MQADDDSAGPGGSTDADKDARWRTIAADLRTGILDGRYPPGGALPSEPELVRRWDVSRPTVRKAIETLVSEGLAYVMRGRGSFVRPTPERRLILISNQNRADLASPAYHPEIRAFGWELAKKDMPEEPFHGERINATRNTAPLCGVRPGQSVIHRHSLWRFPFGGRVEIDSYADAELVPDWDDQKRFHQYRKRPKFFYDSLQRNRGPVRWITLTTARLAYEDERTRLGMSYADAIVLVTRTQIDRHGRLLESTQVKAPASHFEIGHGAELADDPNELFNPEELADEAIALLI